MHCLKLNLCRHVIVCNLFCMLHTYNTSINISKSRIKKLPNFLYERMRDCITHPADRISMSPRKVKSI